MNVTTSRQFRKKHLNDYHFYDFDNFEDYFLYLHMNTRVQWVHLFGALISVPLLPWTLFVLFYDYNPLPFMAYTAIFYGAGFAIHWASDGLISKTVASFGPSFLYVMILNFRLFTGTLKQYEAYFMKKYPHTLWVYQTTPETPDPQEVSKGRNIAYPQWVSQLLLFISLIGIVCTQWSPSLWLGWGLLYLSFFLCLGFPCVIYSEKHNDLDFTLKQQVGDWSVYAIALARLKKENPSESTDIFELQKYNTEFWLNFKQTYQQSMRCFNKAKIKELEYSAKNWQVVLGQKIEKKEWALPQESENSTL